MHRRRQQTPWSVLTAAVLILSALPLRGDEIDEEGFAKLHRMASGGHAQKVEALLEAGADVNVQQRDYRGRPLQYASHFGHPDVVRLLLEWDADVDAVDTHGRTPLMWASMSGRGDVVRLLVEAGANVNAKTEGGWTALRYAEDRAHPAVAEFLLKHGAERPKASAPEVSLPKRSPGQEPDDGTPDADYRSHEMIGAVLGRPVFRREIDREKPLRDELHRLFTTPVMERYQRRLGEKIELTEAEIRAGVAFHSRRAESGDRYLRESWEAIVTSDRDRADELLREAEEKLQDAQLTDEERRNWEHARYLAGWMKRLPGSSMVIWLYGRLKFEQHLYRKFGGGRVLWQQAGLEAFDAMHRWLRRQERKGRIQITDPELREAYYAYWATQGHGAFLRGEEKDDQPEWLAFPWNRETD